jgi:aspartyl-tRNA(Asn)/glutamyl-tRNA(Gln) amidotransferase subunit A
VEAGDGIFLARSTESGGGIRLAVKDLLDTAGVPTTYGSPIFGGHVPAQSADAVLRLERSGYTVVGKTKLDEFAYGTTSENEHFGTVPNPIAPGRIAGGSSGGSAAALSAGLAEAALGTDSGGSIRIPAACCGVVGFKPTFDLISTRGCFPLAPTFDHVGPMARTVEACTEMMGCLAPGFEYHEVMSTKDLRVGIAWLDDAAPLVAERVVDLARHLGALRPVEIPRPDVNAVFMREVAGVHAELYAENSDLYGASVATKIERCLAISDCEAAAADRNRDDYRQLMDELMGEFDLLVTPTLPIVAPPAGIGDLKLRPALTRNTLPFNALGWPALAIPCGPAEEGLPASLQLVGRAGSDGLVLAVGTSLIRGTVGALANAE